MELFSKHFYLSIDDNSKGKWPDQEIAALLNVALPVFEKFVYSDLIRCGKKLHPQISLDLSFCGDQKMKSVNASFRGKDKTTDVLSFPGFSNLRSDKKSDIYPGMIHLGDIIISRNVAIKQAREFNLTTEEEVLHLFVHGFLHLLGYDHEISAKEEKIMQALEEKLIKQISKKIKK